MPTASSSSTPKKMSTSKELSLSLSLDSQSGSFRRDNRPKRPAIEIVPINDDSLDYDDLYVEYDEITSSSYSGNPKQTLPTPQMSTSCLSEPCNFLVAISDESTNIPSSSSFSSYQQETKSDNVAEADINQQTTKHQTFLTPSASTSFRETEKEKSGKRKKKLSLSLQQSHHSDVQVERQLTKSSSNETLIPLTSAQIYLIRNNWRQVYVTKGPTLIGSTILHGMCFKSRKIKDRFFKCPFPHRFPNRDSFNKAHAKAIGEMFDKIVDNSENLGSISSYLFAIGAMHTCLARRQLSREMWNLMAETFIDCTLDWGDKKGRTEASRIAWAFIIAHVIKKIKEGDLNERRRLAHYRQSSLLAPPRLSSTNVSLPSSSTSKLWKSVEECDRNI
ncbi:unnamed protein product [Onchocerca ochengi]|uniref:GLOBIN domain-containing protein n=1 Tax=Onchocerca ochengi TaxID=42157 RepID=A0A182EMG3_ONCOC|nr:unnamed protein product [Onchocerca ochengi]